MSNPSLSVVVPNYNHGRYLAKCLDAIFSQEVVPDEVLVIDDCSTDDSVQVIERFCAQQPVLRLLRNETNRGAVATINRGLTEAKGEYIYFAAADDWILPGLFAQSLRLLRQYPQAGLCSGLSLQVTETHVTPHPFPTAVVFDRPVYIPPHEVRNILLKEGTWFMGNALILRRQAVMEEGGFRPELYSFCDGFLYHVLALRYGACFIPAPLAVWRRSESGYSDATVLNIGRMGDIFDRVTSLMTRLYFELFTDSFVARWQNRLRFTTLTAQVNSGAYDAGVLQQWWPKATKCDRRLLDLTCRSRLGRRIGTLYLFARLRPFDVLPTVRRRLSWLFRG